MLKKSWARGPPDMCYGKKTRFLNFKNQKRKWLNREDLGLGSFHLKVLGPRRRNGASQGSETPPCCADLAHLGSQLHHFLESTRDSDSTKVQVGHLYPWDPRVVSGRDTIGVETYVHGSAVTPQLWNEQWVIVHVYNVDWKLEAVMWKKMGYKL